MQNPARHRTTKTTHEVTTPRVSATSSNSVIISNGIEKSSGGATKIFDCDSFIAKEFAEQQKREEEWRRHQVSSTVVFEKNAAGNEVGGKSTARVEPYEVHDDEDEELVIRPRQETVIEREVKLMRQREGSLRRVRGYPVLSLKDTPVAIEVSSQDEAAVVGQKTTTDNEIDMKRLATNRLRLEILRDRQREIDLRSQGKIHTTSAERIGPPAVLLDELKARELTAQHERKPRTAKSIQPSARSVGEDSSKWSSSVGSGVDQRQVHGVAARSGIKVASRTVGERLIEQEVRELRRREEELRSVLNHTTPTVST